MKTINIIGAGTLAASEANLVTRLLPNVLRRAVRWGSSAVRIASLMITSAAGAGETWDTFASGEGVNGPVRTVTTFGDDLIVGGQFGTAGGVPGTFVIARWDGENWSALGSGTQNSVLALATFNGALYAGGQFPTAGGVSGTSGNARWYGTTWSALGSGPNNTVMSLATFDDGSGSGTELYVGGYFTAPVGCAANSAVQIARWNGAWSAVGSGMVATSYHAVFALSPSFDGDLLYVGGLCEVSPYTVGVAGYFMGYHFVP